MPTGRWPPRPSPLFSRGSKSAGSLPTGPRVGSTCTARSSVRGRATARPRRSHEGAVRGRHRLDGEPVAVVSRASARRPGSSEVARRGEGTRTEEEEALVTPADLDASSAVVLSWLLTYAIHSTILLGLAAAIASRFADEHAWLDLVWKTALLGPLVTASLQVGSNVIPLGGRWPIGVAAPVAGARAMPLAPRTETALKPEQTRRASRCRRPPTAEDRACSRRFRLPSATARGIEWLVCGLRSPCCHGWRSVLSAWSGSARAFSACIGPSVRGRSCLLPIYARRSRRCATPPASDLRYGSPRARRVRSLLRLQVDRSCCRSGFCSSSTPTSSGPRWHTRWRM